MISVVIPTIRGRERWLKRCMDAYKATTPDLELIVIRNLDACGKAWIKGAERASGDYLHFTADDLEPQPGWWRDAVKLADQGGIPGANVLTATDDTGEWREDSTMFAGAFLRGDYREARNVLVPFISRALFDEGEWLLPIHYGSDDWVTFLADVRDIPIPFTETYKFWHHAAPEGRLWDSRQFDIPILCDAMAEHGVVPLPYQRMGWENGWAAA